MSNEINETKVLCDIVKNYAIDNSIKYVVIFAKQIENVLYLQSILNDTDVKVLATTFPNNQILYLEGEDGNINEVTPEILNTSSRDKLKKKGVDLIASTLPLDPIIIPGNEYNPYTVINQTLNLFGTGVNLTVQSALMVTDNGYIKPGERIVSMTASIAVDLTTSNSRFLFHPELGIKIHKTLD